MHLQERARDVVLQHVRHAEAGCVRAAERGREGGRGCCCVIRFFLAVVEFSGPRHPLPPRAHPLPHSCIVSGAPAGLYAGGRDDSEEDGDYDDDEEGGEEGGYGGGGGYLGTPPIMPIMPAAVIKPEDIDRLASMGFTREQAQK